MKKYSVEYIKDRKGQSVFRRQLSWEGITLLQIIADDVRVNYITKRRIEALFIFNRPGLVCYAKIKGLKSYEAERILPMSEWKPL